MHIKRVWCGWLLLSGFILSGCGHWFEDNGTHLAFALEQACQQMQAEGVDDLWVHYRTLDDVNVSYYVEITPSIQPDWPANSRWGSYLVVSGITSGGTSYHNRFVYVPERLYIKKPDGGETLVHLRRAQDRIEVIELK